MKDLIGKNKSNKAEININKLIDCEEVEKIVINKGSVYNVYRKDGSIIDIGVLGDCHGVFVEIRDVYKLSDLMRKYNQIGYDSNSK